MKLIYTLTACFLICSGLGRASSRPTGATLSDFCNGNANDAPDCITPPIATYSPEPKYPDNERKAGREGDVALNVVIGTDGATHDISVARSLSPDFDNAAIAVVQTWRFTPAKKTGSPIPLHTQIQVGFHLRR